MMGSRGLKSGTEYDTLTRWRRLIGRQPQDVRAAKRTFRKRMRREARLSMQNAVRSEPLVTATGEKSLSQIHY
jgi:hypothetical protein